MCNCLECSSAANTPKGKNRSCKSLAFIRDKAKILINTFGRCPTFVYQNVHVFNIHSTENGGRLLSMTENKM